MYLDNLPLLYNVSHEYNELINTASPSFALKELNTLEDDIDSTNLYDDDDKID